MASDKRQAINQSVSHAIRVPNRIPLRVQIVNFPRYLWHRCPHECRNYDTLDVNFQPNKLDRAPRLVKGPHVRNNFPLQASIARGHVGSPNRKCHTSAKTLNSPFPFIPLSLSSKSHTAFSIVLFEAAKENAPGNSDADCVLNGNAFLLSPPPFLLTLLIGFNVHPQPRASGQR